MKCRNINFPAQTYSSPGIYSYTIKELTPSDEKWQTDNRIYRAVVTVTDNGDGTLDAQVDYPDGFPEFVNRRSSCDICKHFNCLPFPMLFFSPPQKKEFSPEAFDEWNNAVKFLRMK